MDIAMQVATWPAAGEQQSADQGPLQHGLREPGERVQHQGLGEACRHEVTQMK